MLTQAPASVRQISVIFKTHLDIGFTDFASSVIRRYLKDYIPAALQFAKRTRGSRHRFVWTTGSWIACRYLEDSTPANRKLMEEAILAGDFHWHALPFTMHTELMDSQLFEKGLSFSQELDKRFGRITGGAKMTDVPGHTRAIVPLLAAAGVKLLHIGVNPSSKVPTVPPAFVWRSGGAELVVVYDKEYGGVTALPGGMAVSVNLTNDNLGPHNPREIDCVYRCLQKRFPRAKIHAASLNSVADWAWNRREELPVVTSEIGDTWIHGVGTDPAKVARFRELSRLRNRWIFDGRLPMGGRKEALFSENLLLVAEHTWGLDIKTHFGDWNCFGQRSIPEVLGGSNARKVQASWDEQRAYLDHALEGLPGKLRQESAVALRSLKPVLREKTGWQSVSPAEALALRPWVIGFDTNGAICLLRQKDGTCVADARHCLARLEYQTFSNIEYNRFYNQYNHGNYEWALKDFTKPGLPDLSPSRRLAATLTRLSRNDSGEQLLAELQFALGDQNFGAPSHALMEVTAVENGVDLRLEWYGKSANPMPEALWLNFTPLLSTVDTWKFLKMGLWVDPADVVLNGNRTLHAVDGKVAAGRFEITSLDAPLAAPGHGSLLNFNNRRPAFKKGISFNLYNNIWGTNFPMWYSDNSVFRFELRWS